MAKIPDYIYEMAEYSPSIDVGLAILREAFPDLAAAGHIVSLIPNKADNLPLILVRDYFDGAQASNFGRDAAPIEVMVFTEDPPLDEVLEGAPSGETQGAVLSEAIRVAMRDAWLRKAHYPGVAKIAHIRPLSRARRVTDWETPSGPVQYADLPTGYWRHESAYLITYKPA